jgi:hypothetical protein
LLLYHNAARCQDLEHRMTRNTYKYLFGPCYTDVKPVSGNSRILQQKSHRVFGHRKFSGPALKICRTQNHIIFTVTSFGGVSSASPLGLGSRPRYTGQRNEETTKQLRAPYVCCHSTLWSGWPYYQQVSTKRDDETVIIERP